MLPSQGSVAYEKDGNQIPINEIFKHVSIATPYMDLIDEFTLEEMINFHFKFKRARNNKSTEELIDLFELGRAKDKSIANFSSGMKQRLKLGLAFYSQTDLLFLDEPTTNLDSKSIDWFTQHRDKIPTETLIFIASNQEHEYPKDAQKIDILTFKKGY
jgi:ABC-type multidrug transport system ATPase subunit